MTKYFFTVFACLALASFSLSSHSDITIKSNKPVEASQADETGKKPAKSEVSELTKEEADRVKELTENYEKEVSSIKPQIQDKTKLLKKELNSNAPNIDQMKSLNKELFELKEQEQLKKIEYQFALSRFLSAQKRKELNKAKNTKKQEKNPQKP